jgi:putative endonuclease
VPTGPGHFVYIVRCGDGSLYTGYARDVKARVRAHNSGRGAKYTAGRRPVRLVYSEACETRSAALKREYALKQLSRKKKLELLFGLSSRQRHVRRRHQIQRHER